jgi:hypothetical protein
MDVEFAPPKLNPVHPTVVGSTSFPGEQPVPSVAVAVPTPHPGITLIGPPPSAGMRLRWTQPALRPIASGNDQALLYAAANAGNTAVMSLLLGNDPGPAHKYHALCHAVSARLSRAYRDRRPAARQGSQAEQAITPTAQAEQARVTPALSSPARYPQSGRPGLPGRH